MKNLCKRSLSLLLAMVMILGMMPMNALTVQAEEISEEHSLANAHGVIWLIKAETDTGASDAFVQKVEKLLLDDMVRTAIGETDSTKKVTYFYEGEYRDINDMWTFLKYPEMATAMGEEIAAAVADHQLVTFQVGGVNKSVAFRNILIANINVPDVVIEGAGAPEDFREQVAAALDNPQYTITHIEAMTLELARGELTVNRVDNYEWPEPGDEPLAVGTITVTIVADDDASVTMTQTGTVYLKESRGLFDVKFISNGETLLDTKIVEGEATPEVADPVREYYTFKGWMKDGEGEPGAADATVTAPVTYVAKWEADLDITGPNGEPDGIADQEQFFNITFNDGVADKEIFEDQQSTLQWGTETPVPSFNRPYYNFLGWLKNGAEVPGEADAIVTDHASYVAAWVPEIDHDGDDIADQEQKYTVTYTDGVDGQVIFADLKYTLAWGSEIPEFTPSRTYYTFEGWNEPVADTITGNVTYVAQWKAINDKAPNGGDGIADEEQSFTITYTDGVTDKVIFEDVVHEVAYGKMTPFFTPEREYYTFMGWSPEVSSKVSDNATYVAQWKANLDVNNNGIADQEETFTVIYKDGKNEDVVYTVAWGEVTPSYNPAHEYYTFLGWDKDVAYRVREDATYTGKGWKAKVDNNGNGTADQEETFVIEFYVDGVLVEKITTNGGITTPVPAVTPEQTGFQFVGWKTTTGVDSKTVKVSADAEYHAEFSSSSIVNYIVYYWNDTPTTFSLAATETGYAQNPGVGAVEGTIWSGWLVEGTDEPFDFGTVLDGNITIYCTYQSDANKDGKVDGSQDDPYLYYIYKNQSGVTMEQHTTAEHVVPAYPVSNTDEQVFTGWVKNFVETVDNGVYTHTYTYTPTFDVDRNNNEKVDGSAEDPFVYYVFLDNMEDAEDESKWLAKIKWLAGDAAVNPAVYQSKVTLDASIYEKFAGWATVESTYDNCKLYLYVATRINDRNDNGIQDGSENDPFSYYVVLNRDGSELYNEDWLDGEPVVNCNQFIDNVVLDASKYEKFVDWAVEVTELADGGKKYVYTPSIIIDRNDNNKQDGSAEDPYSWHIIQDHNGNVLLNADFLPGEDTPNMEVYKQMVINSLDASKYERFMSWAYTITENENGETVHTKIAYVINDRNYNGQQDGGNTDPYTEYVILDHNGKELLNTNWLEGEPEIIVDDYIDAIEFAQYEVFVKWNETIETDGVTVRKTYTAEVMVDENGNGKPDGEEVDEIKIPLDANKFAGFEAKYENGMFVITGTIGGETYTGYVQVTDATGKSVLKGEGTFDYTDDVVIKATPLWTNYEGPNKMYAYVAAIKVNGEAQTVYYQDYEASNKPMGGIALMMAMEPIDESNSDTLEVVYELATLTERVEHLPIELGKTQYSNEEIYNAIFAAPAYDAEDMGMMYLAREAGSAKVDLSYFYQRLAKLDPNAPDMVKTVLKTVYGGDGNSVDVSWDEVWFSIDAEVTGNDTPQTAADAYIDGIFASNPNIDQLVNDAVSIFDGIKTRVNESANLRSFASIAEGQKEVTEQIVVNYVEPNGKFFVDYEAKITLKETRLNTTITVPSVVTVTYGEFSNGDLLSKAKLVDENGKDITHMLKLDHDLYQNYVVGTHEVKVVLQQDNVYKANSKTFTLIVQKATPTITIEEIQVTKGEAYDPTPVVTPEAAQIVHVIAGVELEQLDIDLLTGVVENKNAGNLPVKAWISLPEFYQDVLKIVGIGDEFYTVEGVKDALRADALGKELVDKLDPALESIDSMLKMAEDMVVENLGVDIEFTLYITFEKGAKPVEPGFYLNYAQIMDTANYEEVTAYATLIITPMIAMPNKGIELVYSDINDNQNFFVFENDGTQKNLKAVYEGKYVDAEITYYGLTTRGEMADTAPEAPGLYLATAIYTSENDGSISLLGSDVALVWVNVSNASIEVESKSEIYDGAAKYPVITIKDQNGKNIGGGMTVISGSVDQDVEGNNVGLEQIHGNVNIDFPADLDAAWNKFCSLMKVDVSNTVYPSTVISFLNWYNEQIDAQSATVIETLSSLQVKAETTQQVLDAAKGAANELKKQVEKLPNNVSVSFKNKNELKYTETGAYLFVGIITDPELMPDVNAGLLIIKSAATFEMFDTYVPYNGKAQSIAVDDQSARDNVTIIFDTKNNQVNFILDETMTTVVEKVLVKAGYKLQDGSNAYAGTVYSKGDDVAELLTDAIVAKIASYNVNVAGLEGKLDKLANYMSAKLQDLDKMNDETLVFINGQLPVNVGSYKFYGFDYDVAYTSATLNIMPIHIVLDVEDAEKIYGNDDPEFKVTAEYYSYAGIAPNGAAKVDATLPVGVKLSDVVSYEVGRADNNNAGTYDLILEAALKNTSGNYVLDTKKVTGTLEINPLDVTVSATVEPGIIKVGETAEVTVKVTAGDQEINVDTDFTYDTENFTRAGNVLTAKKQGEYVITPAIVGNSNYNVVNTVDAILTVENIEVTITADVKQNEIPVGEAAENVEIEIVVTDSEGNVLANTGLVDGTYLVKNADGETVTLAAALQLAGTYTVEPNYVAVEGYEVVNVVNDQFVVTVVPVTVEVLVNGSASAEVEFGGEAEITVTAIGNGTDYAAQVLQTPAYKICNAADEEVSLIAALNEVGSYTITPVYKTNVKGLTVETVKSATLVVKTIDITVAATLEKNEVVVGAPEAEIGLKTVVTNAKGKEVVVNGLLKNTYTVKNSNGETVALADALNTVGTYTITADYNAVKGYNVQSESVTLTVCKAPELSVGISTSKISVVVGTAAADVSIIPVAADNVSPAGTNLIDLYQITYVIENVEGEVVALQDALNAVGTYTIVPVIGADISKFGENVTIKTCELEVVQKQVNIVPVVKIGQTDVSGKTIKYGTVDGELAREYKLEAMNWTPATGELEALANDLWIFVTWDNEVDLKDLLEVMGTHTFSIVCKGQADSVYSITSDVTTLTINPITAKSAIAVNTNDAVITGTTTITVGDVEIEDVATITYNTDAKAVYDALNVVITDETGKIVSNDYIAYLKAEKVDAAATFAMRANNYTNPWDSMAAVLTDVGVYKISPVFKDLSNSPYSEIITAETYLVIEPLEVTVSAQINNSEVTTAGTVELSYVVKDSNGNVIPAEDVIAEVKFVITDAEGNEVTLVEALSKEDTYTITPVVTAKDNENYKISATVGTVTLTVKNIDVTVTATLDKNSVYIVDNETVTVTVTSSVDVAALNVGYTITKGDKTYTLADALKEAGTYTVSPTYTAVKGYDVDVVPATLEVKKTPVTVTAVVAPEAVDVFGTAEVTIVAKNAAGEVITIDGLTNANYTIEGGKTLAEALNAVGTYTIKPVTTHIENAYEVTAENATLTVNPIKVNVSVVVEPAKIHVGETAEIKVVVTDGSGNVITDSGVDADDFIMKNESDEVVALADAMNTVGVYTVEPVTTGVTGNYEIGNAESATLNVLKPLWNVSFANMTLANSLSMNFAFEAGHETDWTGCYAKIVKTYADGRDDIVETIPADEWVPVTIGRVEHFKITFTAIAAKEMGDDVYVTVYSADGEALSHVWHDSVKAYAERAWDKCVANAGVDFEEELTMLADMLNYGAAAQKLFGYDVDHLVNADLTAEQKAYATKSVEYENKIVKGENYFGANLSLENSMRFNMAFANATTDMTAKVTFVNHAGRKIDEAVELTIDGKFGIVNVNQIAVADGRTMVTVTVYNADGTVYGTVTDSMESYIARVSGNEPEKAELYEKIMMFCDSVYAFKH